MLSADGRAVTVAEAALMLRQRGPSFLRPDSDSKQFDGGVYEPERFERLRRALAIADSMPAVIASPVRLDAEWRFFVVDGEVAGCSEYRRRGRISTEGSVPRGAMEFAAETAKEWGPADVYCLDLGASEGRIGIVEANCFNASQFYGAPVDRVLRAVNEFVSRNRTL